MEEPKQGEEINSVESAEPKKSAESSKKIISKSFLICLIIVLFVVALAGGMLYWRDTVANEIETKQENDILTLNKTIVSLKKQLADAKDSDKSTSSESNQTACTEVQPGSSAIENIKASITSGDTVALGGHMASSVNVILAATEAYGAQTSSQAVSSITNFISDATSPWDFSLASSVLSVYSGGGYSQYFSTISVVGKSADGKVISFSFDCNGKIDQVFMAGNEELL